MDERRVSDSAGADVPDVAPVEEIEYPEDEDGE